MPVVIYVINIIVPGFSVYFELHFGCITTEYKTCKTCINETSYLTLQTQQCKPKNVYVILIFILF